MGEIQSQVPKMIKEVLTIHQISFVIMVMIIIMLISMYTTNSTPTKFCCHVTLLYLLVCVLIGQNREVKPKANTEITSRL